MYQANLQLSAGTSFSQTFSITESDGSATDITGYTISARMAKHDGALNAVKSTSDVPLWKYIDLTTAVVNATSGQYSISLSPDVSVKLEEGKYVYSVVTEDTSGVKTEVVSGLVFVDKGFAVTGTYGSLDPNYP